MPLIRKRTPKGVPVETAEEVHEQYFAAGERQITDLIVPGQLEIARTYLTLDDQYCRTFAIANWPRYASSYLLDSFYGTNRTFDLSFHLYPYPTATALKQMRTSRVILLSQRLGGGGIGDPQQDLQNEDILRLQADLVSNREKLLSVMVYYTVRARSLDELAAACEELTRTLRQLDMDVRPLYFEQLEALRTTLPFGRPSMERFRRNIPAHAFSTLFPFIDEQFDNSAGIFYGINTRTARPLIVDRFGKEANNFNATIFGTAGSGKSYTIKVELLQQLLAGVDCIVIDPEGEFVRLAEALETDDGLGASVVNVSLGSKDHLNPFDFFRVDAEDDDVDILGEKIVYLVSLIDLMTSRREGASLISQINQYQRNILDLALHQVFAAAGITSQRETHNRKKPVLRDLYEHLRNAYSSDEDGSRADDREAQEAQMLALLLQQYAVGAYAKFFNERTTVELNRRLLVFNTKSAPKEMLPVITAMITDFVWNRALQNPKKRIFVIDELWLMLEHVQLANFVENIYRRARKFGLGITGLTQQVAEVLASPVGGAVLGNSYMRVLLRQNPGGMIEEFRHEFGLQEKAANDMTSFQKGEGLYLIGDKTIRVRGQLMPAAIDELITSDRSQLIEIAAREKRLRGEE